MEVRLGQDVLDTVVAQVRDAVDGGWSGAAAESFAAAWQEWSTGAEQVCAALTSIVASLETARRELAAADGASAADSHSLLERLG